MTREELIESLTLLKEQARNSGANTFVWDINIDSFNFVMDSAIEVLEQEPTTKNNLGVDCIDRAELLKAMDTWDKFGYTETGCFVRAPKNDCVPYVHYNDIVNCVKGMPSVTPQEPREGHWDIKDNMWWVCSACGCQTRMMKKYNVPRFCPACGAKMVEPQESEG